MTAIWPATRGSPRYGQSANLTGNETQKTIPDRLQKVVPTSGPVDQCTKDDGEYVIPDLDPANEETDDTNRAQDTFSDALLPITKASITEERNPDVDISYGSDGDVNQATDDVNEIRTGSAAESDDTEQTREPLLTVR